jgi:hypothetical protein
MALSNGKNYSNDPLVFLSPRSKTKDKDGKSVEIDKPYFEVGRVNPETTKIEKTEERPTEVSGDLSGIQFKTREFNGVTTAHTVLFLKDTESKETYHIDLTSRISTRSLFNALLNLQSPNGISIGIYRSKKGFESFGVSQGGVNVKWKYELKDLPQPEKITNKKGEVIQTDYSEGDTLFENELKALAAKFGFSAGKKEAAESASSQPVSKTTPASKPAPAGETDTGPSDVPF